MQRISIAMARSLDKQFAKISTKLLMISTRYRFITTLLLDSARLRPRRLRLGNSSAPSRLKVSHRLPLERRKHLVIEMRQILTE
jgi:hypothetical protein